MEVREVIFYKTQPHQCGYFNNMKATNVVLDPGLPASASLYGRLLAAGFRRSGDYVYRPDCRHCGACVSLRLPVTEMRFNRSQRRTIKRNVDLQVTRVSMDYYAEHFELYRHYLAKRHPDGPMLAHSRTEYMGFLRSRAMNTGLLEFRLGQRLLAVAVTDYLEDSLSAVYTFYDPEQSARSLGTYAILRQIEEARRLQKKWLYLGYWIHDSGKMRYKSTFMPAEAYVRGGWQRVESAQALLLRYNGNLTETP